MLSLVWGGEGRQTRPKQEKGRSQRDKIGHFPSKATTPLSLLPRLPLKLPLSAVLVKPVEVCGISCLVAFAKNKKNPVKSTFFPLLTFCLCKTSFHFCFLILSFPLCCCFLLLCSLIQTSLSYCPFLSEIKRIFN